MKYRKRRFYSECDKQMMWDRWQRGDSIREIAQLFDRYHSSVQGVFSKAGGVRPRPRRRSRLALTVFEREEISRGLVAGHSIRTIASSLGRAPSTVSREIKRNGGRRTYRASRADRAAWDRARRPKICKLVVNRKLARAVATKLKQWWSPEQIAGWLKDLHPNDEHKRVSHETIYRSLFIQARGALKQELLAYLRTQRGMRRPRSSSRKGKGLGQITGTIGSNNSQIATLVERHTRYCMLVRVPGKDTETVIDALIRQAHKLPRELYKSLTWDRGKEMADHQRFTLDTDIKVYFCDPKSPWQRGSNENTNGLLRQYFPKGMDLSGIHQNRLNAVARQLNERPRKTLQFKTPAYRFEQCVASTG